MSALWFVELLLAPRTLERGSVDAAEESALTFLLHHSNTASVKAKESAFWERDPSMGELPWSCRSRSPTRKRSEYVAHKVERDARLHSREYLYGCLTMRSNGRTRRLCVAERQRKGEYA
jgi:hypothetical protein